MRDTKDVMNLLEVPGRCELGEVQASREWIIPSSLTQVEWVVSEALAELAGQPEVDAVELALHEALTNAISHGNQESISKAVRVTLVRRSNGGVVLIVKDCGAGFDVNKVSDPLGDRLMSPRGRGIFLMRQLMAGVDFVYDHGTEVRLWLTPPTSPSRPSGSRSSRHSPGVSM